MLSSLQPMALWWGGDSFQFYNDAARPAMAHPSALGQVPEDAPGTLWEALREHVHSVLARGTPLGLCDVGPYATVQLSPVRGGQSQVLGVLGILCETRPASLLHSCKQSLLAAEQKLRENRQQTEAQVAAERANIKALFEHLPAFFCILTGDEYRFEYVNPAHRATFLGRDCTGQTIREAIPESKTEIVPILDRVMRTGEALIIRETPVVHGGVTHYYDVTHAPRHNLKGEIDGIVVLGTDITEEVVARRKLETLTQDLQNAVRMRDDFLRIASHELNTPVTSMKLQTQMMKRFLRREDALPVEPARLRKLLDHTDVGLGRLSRLIDDMLDISRIDGGKLSLTLERFDLRDLLKGCVERLSPQEQAAKATFVLNAVQPVVGSWDRFRIEQIVLNLLVNALRYGKSPIEVVLHAESRLAHVTVRDHGLGIPHENQERIFERFETGNASKSIKGLGLGLYICREIAHCHGGEVGVQSEPGLGAAFTLTLPIDVEQSDGFVGGSTVRGCARKPET